MISDDLGQVLHDRSTRGEPLSDEEQTQLDSWYDDQDQLERNSLAAMPEARTTATLQAQIEAALAQLTRITTRLQAMAAENEQLRQEITTLRRQLVESPSSQQTV